MLFQVCFKRFIFGIKRSVLLSALVLLNGCLEARTSGQSRTSNQPCTDAQDQSDNACYVVNMMNYFEGETHVFEPGYLKVSPGDRVIFNSVNYGHNVVSVSIPKGAKEWESGLSKNISLLFTVPGVYLYKCEPHDTAGMIGVIQVGDSFNNYTTALKIAKSLNIISNDGRLNDYFSKLGDRLSG
jgi:pseudoazurin